LLAAGKRFIERGTGPFYLVCDGTHEFGLQRWKLLSLGFVGVRWDGSKWTTTFLPLGFVVSRTETGDAANALCTSVIAAMRQLGVDLVDRVEAVFLDGGAGLLKGVPPCFPKSTTRRCLQHTTKDLTTGPGAWRKGVNVGRLRWLVEDTAFFPKHLFNFTWQQELAKYEKQHGADSKLWEGILHYFRPGI